MLWVVIIVLLNWCFKLEKLAFISDIHSNLPALESTLNHIKNLGINRIYCLGDIIGYHSFTNEVIELLKDNKVISIKGNHDQAITEMCFDRSKESDFVLYWNYDALNEENKNYLINLPDTMRLNIEDSVIDLVHGSPGSITEYIREGSAEAEKYLDSMTSDVLLCAHTHMPYIMEKDGRFLLNTGSVGKPKFGKPEVSYIVITIEGKTISPEIISHPYDTKSMTDHLNINNFPKKLIKAIETGLP